MSLIFNGTTIENIVYNSTELTKIIFNGTTVWEKITGPSVNLQDFEYIDNGDGTYTLTAWKGTYNGSASTKLIIPDDSRIIL